MKDLFNQNTIKSSEEILEKLVDKRNWMCEYRTIKNALKRGTDRILNTSYLIPNVSNKSAFNFMTGNHNFLDQKCSFFYKNLLHKKFQSPIHQSSLSRKFVI